MVQQYVRMVQKSVAMRGVLGTAAYAVRWPFVVVKERRSFAERNAVQQSFDAQYGTDTAGIIPLSSFAIDDPVWVHGVRYAPTSQQDFRDAVAMLSPAVDRAAEFTFVDVGSGKGATLLYAADMGFKAAVGVELVAPLHAIAQRNIALYPPARGMGRSVCADATRFKMPPPPLLVFMNYPFSSAALMDQVIDNISACGGGPAYLLAINYPYDPATLPRTRANRRLRPVKTVTARHAHMTQRRNFAFEVIGA